MYKLFFLLTSIGLTSAWIFIQALLRDSYPLGYKPLTLALKMINCNHDKDLNLDVSDIQVYFYDFSNNVIEVFPINEAAQGILSMKTLDRTKKVNLFVGGFRSNIENETEEKVRNAFKTHPNNYLIIIDHSAYTYANLAQKRSYERSVKYVFYIGKQLAQMLADLHQGGIPAKNIHCTGHSLGGQILGYTGNNFFNATGQKLSKITALDPAGPCFTNASLQDQVRSGVAEYVEVYHCNAGNFGTSSVLADVNFFVNNGASQPNCTNILHSGVLDSICSHMECVAMWTSSVIHPDMYAAYKCDTFKNFQEGECLQNEKTTAGFFNPCTANGVYYFSTQSLR